MPTTKEIRKETKKIIDTIDERMLLVIHSMLKKDSELDWWDELDNETLQSIEKGLLDIKEGNVVSHDEVMKKYKKWVM